MALSPYMYGAVARHEVTTMSIVGDAFGRPLADEIEARPRDLPSLRYLISGGAALSAVHKERLVTAVPGLTVIESIGSSEMGVQGRTTGVDGGPPRFAREPSARVLSEDRTTALEPGHEGTRLARHRRPRAAGLPR